MNKAHGKRSIAVVSLGACALTQGAGPFPIGGSELQLYLLAGRLAAHSDLDVTLYVADLGQGETRDQGMRVVPLVRVGPALGFSVFGALGLVRRLARARHDLYITRSASGLNGLVNIAAGLVGGRHLHMCAHDHECAGRPDATLSGMARWLHRRAMLRCDVLTCQTERQRRSLEVNFGREAAAVPNLMPRSGASVPADERRGALWVGRDVAWKQPERFIELAERCPDYPFTMVCQPQPGHDVARLERAAPANLTFHRGLTFGETNDLFARHRVFVCTSEAEGFPNTFLQAAAAGTPIVSLGVDPDGIIARNSAGFVCSGSFDELVENVHKVLTDPSVWEACHENSLRLGHDQERVEKRIVRTVRELAK